MQFALQESIQQRSTQASALRPQRSVIPAVNMQQEENAVFLQTTKIVPTRHDLPGSRNAQSQTLMNKYASAYVVETQRANTEAHVAAIAPEVI